MILFNSMVRGFGSQVGRRAANSMIDSRSVIAPKSEWIKAGILLALVVGSVCWLYKTGKEEQLKQNTSITQPTTTSVEIPKSDTYKGHVVFTGKRGGKYYYSKSGRKVYIN